MEPLNLMATTTYKRHVTKSLGLYDMIISRYLLDKLGIEIYFSTKTVSLHDVSIPMKITEYSVIELFHINDPKGINKMID